MVLHHRLSWWLADDVGRLSVSLKAGMKSRGPEVSNRLFEKDSPPKLSFHHPVSARTGSLLVVEANAGRLSRIDPATGNISILAEGLQVGYSIPMVYNNVAVASSGAIYVTGFTPGLKMNLLYRIEIHR